MNPFYRDVYDVVKLIPVGRVTNYGAIARYLGSPQASRMVGYAMNSCHTQPDYIPAHRVVNRLGMLTGKHHFPGEHIMQELLENEEINIKNDQIQDFKRHFWDPNVELSIDK